MSKIKHIHHLPGRSRRNDFISFCGRRTVEFVNWNSTSTCLSCLKLYFNTIDPLSRHALEVSKQYNKVLEERKIKQVQKELISILK